ncbi:MAG: hypothetical protein WC815_03925 [Vicinamibacterales bacterium]
MAHILPRAPLRLFEAPIFYPDAHTLAYSEHLLVPSLIGAPLLWLGAPPLVVSNLLIILGLALSGWVMCLVINRWTGSMAAGVIAGLLYAFNAHVLTRFPHVQAQHVEFFPLILYALDRVLAGGKRRDTALLAAAFILQALCSNYLLVFCTFAVAAAAAGRPSDWWGSGRRHVRIELALAAVVIAVVLAPFLWPYYQLSRDQGLTRSIGEVAAYSAGWRDYLVTGGRLHYAWWSHQFFESRTALFPGITAVVLAGVALGSGTAFRDVRARMSLAIGILGIAFSFGPGLPGYATLHQYLPLLAGIRNAARWGWLGLGAISVLAGFGVAHIERAWLARVGGGTARVRSWAAVSVAIGVVASAEAIRAPVGFTPFTRVAPIYDRLAAEPGVVLAEFPFYSENTFSRNGKYLLNNTRSFTPLVNGYSGFESAAFRERARTLAGFPSIEALSQLKALGVTHVTVHAAEFADRHGGNALQAVALAPALELIVEDDGIRLYKVR